MTRSANPSAGIVFSRSPLVFRALALLTLLVTALGLSACDHKPFPDKRKDIHSYAHPDQARVKHVDLDLKVDFAAKTLSGQARLDLDVAKGVSELVLDTRGLAIAAVTDADGKPLAYSFGREDKILGQPLKIRITDKTRQVSVRYSTRPEAEALQWLSPEQTAGKVQPFLFSQGQAILTRTWIPTQDSPGIRQTYSARIVVPEGLKAVMSAEMLTPEGEPVAGGRAFRFRLDQPVAPYLIAIGVGDLAFKPLGPRTGVFAEPVTLDRAANELTDVEAMVTAAEKLYGPYRWGRYDLLILPPSFPFGGMENPRLTFATPTILAGDKSLVSLVAHELAHSWSGNLVTNATWSDFWLNEGFTTYFENRIMEELYGRDRALMLQSLGWRDLNETVTELGGPKDKRTKLYLDLAGQNPDDGMNDVAYEKGAAFLRMLEASVGRPAFDAYLKGYFERHAFQSMTTKSFAADLKTHLIKDDKALEAKLKLDAWFYKPGIPDNAVAPVSEAFARVDAQTKAFLAGTPASALMTQGWTTQEWQQFLGGLPDGDQSVLTPAQLADLDKTFALSAAGNSEIRFAWLMLAVRHRYDPALPSLEQFLTSQGRRKFVAPLFTALMAEEGWGPDKARALYAKARPGYHSVTTNTLDPVVK